MRRTTVMWQSHGCSSRTSDSVMPPPPRIVTRAPSRLRPCGGVHSWRPGVRAEARASRRGPASAPARRPARRRRPCRTSTRGRGRRGGRSSRCRRTAAGPSGPRAPRRASAPSACGSRGSAHTIASASAERDDVAAAVADRLGHPGRGALGGEGDARGLGSRHGRARLVRRPRRLRPGPAAVAGAACRRPGSAMATSMISVASTCTCGGISTFGRVEDLAAGTSTRLPAMNDVMM